MNVVVGDVTIAEDINIAAAVEVVAQLCPDVDQIALLATEVDEKSRSQIVCRQEDVAKVRFVQN